MDLATSGSPVRDASRLGAAGGKVLRSAKALVPLLLCLVLLSVACNTAPASSRGTGGEELVPRFLLGGWVFPEGEEVGPFAETLRTFVLTSEQGVRDLLDGLDLVRTRGNMEALTGADVSKVAVLAAYYLWRPLKGDPLSLKAMTLKGTEVEVDLELLEDPQGRESPFLMAPLYVAALDRAKLPLGIPITFAFQVNGEAAGSLTVTLE